MDVKTALFYLFAAILLFAAFRVITSRNPVYAALYLVLAFFQAAAIWILLKAEFLAITLVLVYVGAVMVLFLFVVMMLDIMLYTQYLYPVEVAAVILLVAIVAAIALTLRQRKDSKYVNPSDQISVKARDRMEIVKVDAIRLVEPAAAAEGVKQ